MSSAAPPSKPIKKQSRRPRHRRRLQILLGIVLALLVAGGGAALYVASRLGEWIETAVVRKAAERGIILGVGQLDWSLDGVVLTKSNLTLSGVPSVVLALERIDANVLIDFDGITITRLQLEGAKANLVGSAAMVGFQLGQWTAKYASKADLSVNAMKIDVTWQASADQQPWLEVHHCQLSPADGSGSLVAEEVTLAGQSIGTVRGEWSKSETNFTIGLGEEKLEKAPVQVSVVHTGEKRALDASLAPTPLEQLEAAFGVNLPAEKMTVEARVHIELDTSSFESPASGWLKTTLHGFIPPHPPELDGFVFGDKTLFETQLFIDEKRAKVRLEQAKVQAGRFILKGQGAVAREQDVARLMLELKGALPCTALAGAAVESRLGKVIGPWLRRAAEKVVQGSVTVKVKVDAASDNLEQMRVARLIGIGCGLKPLKLPGFEDFDLPTLAELPDLNDVLPPLPSGLPGLPGIKPKGGASKPNSPLPSLPIPRIQWGSLKEDAPPPKRTLSGRGDESDPKMRDAQPEKQLNTAAEKEDAQ